MTSARAWRRAARSTLTRVASSLATRMLGMPPSTMTSASETLAQVTPIAPKSIWRRAIHGDLWPFEWGRQSLPPAAMALDSRSTLASNRPRSSRRDGVSSSAFGRPSRGSMAAALVVATDLPCGRDGAGTVRPGGRHCRLSTIAPQGDHDGGRRLGRVLGRDDGTGQRAFRRRPRRPSRSRTGPCW